MMERDPEASGMIEIRDGGESGTLIHKFDINNGTFPVSLTTQSNKMGIIFNNNVPHRPSGDPTKRCKHLRGCIRFLFELTTNYGKYLVNALIWLQDEMSHDMREPVYAICKQQRRRSACACAQYGQHLCCSQPR